MEHYKAAASGHFGLIQLGAAAVIRDYYRRNGPRNSASASINRRDTTEIMSDLSTLAETIADYAVSIAKRNENERAGEVHLLAAIRRWRTERFDERFPDLGAQLDEALRSSRGTALRVDGLDDAARQRLSGVSKVDDVWGLADELVPLVPSLTSTLEPRPPSGSSDRAQAHEAGASKALAGHSFPITESLLARVNTVHGASITETASRVLSDAYAVATQVLGQAPESLEQSILDEIDFPGISFTAAEQLSSFVGQLSQAETLDAGKVATQLAMALVEVAQWAAVLDASVTEEETDRIDNIRMELRRQLADRLDAESPAVAEFERKFSGLVGLDSVKAELRRRVDFLTVTKRRELHGHKDGGHRMHLAFVGNPGTGKTTVARLYGELLNDLGLLPTSKFVETDRSGLVAEYVGQTETKTRKVLESADGGVLFIDEAYALNDRYSEQHKGFGEEATDVLVKQMEDRRDRLVVVLAGYRKPILNFMEMNPGLRSRVPLVIDFPDYTRDELAEICRRVAEKAGLRLDVAAVQKMANLLEKDRAKEGFGNARAAENLLEAAHRGAVSRMSALGNLATEDELSTIIAADVPDSIEVGGDIKSRRVGFL